MDRLYRLLATLGLLPASTFAVFALLRAAPGGPLAAYLQSPSIGASDIAVLHHLGPDQPVFVQYFAWLSRVLRGDLGWSPSNSLPVSQALVERLPATIELSFFALMAAIVLGALIGFLRARARALLLRDVVAVAVLVCRALPIVVLALFLPLLLVFTMSKPPWGIGSAEAFDVRDRLTHLIVPVLSLAVPFGAWSSLIFYDFFRAPDGAWRRSVRSVVEPVAMTAALIGPALLSATLIIEPPFAWPGIARLFYNGISQADIGLVAGFLLMYAVGVVLLRLCAEFSPVIPERKAPRQPSAPPPSARRSRNVSAMGVIASIVLLSAAFGALAANLIAPIGPNFIDVLHWEGFPLAPGVAGHPLGTDENGRDLLSRLLVGLRTSLGIAAVAAVVATVIAAVAAWATKAVPWLNDGRALGVTGIRPFAALPFILAVILVLAASHNTTAFLSPLVIGVVIGGVSWPAIVPACRALGPAALGGIVDVTACALLLEITLSGHGFGVQPPTPSLGNMLVNAQSNLTVAPWAALMPSVVGVVMLCALYAVADDLRERAR